MVNSKGISKQESIMMCQKLLYLISHVEKIPEDVTPNKKEKYGGLRKWMNKLARK